VYKLVLLAHRIQDDTLPGSPTEGQVWMRDIAPSPGQMPQNVAGIRQYAFTAMFNNALEHSEGSRIGVDAIVQAFAGEIFRVFPARHPEVSVVEIKASSAAKRMISRARSAR
jgi:hypothetical protein